MRTFSQDAWLLLAPALLFLYYLAAYFSAARKRDFAAKPGPLVIRYEPPSGLSPAAVRFVLTTGSDGRSLAAVIAELATRGCLRVEPLPASGKYKLSQLMSDRATTEKLAPEEKDLLATLFEDGPVLELTPALDQRNSAQNSRYVFHIQQQLQKRLKGLYFKRQSGVVAGGILATFAAVFLLAINAPGSGPTEAVFFSMWILFVGLTLGFIVGISFLPLCRDVIRDRSGLARIVPGLAALAAFACMIGFLFTRLYQHVSPAFSLAILALLVVNLGWAPFLKYTTPLGRKALDEIAGFRAFLESVEKDRLDKLNPVGETPQNLDDCLSYAIALEVEEAWGDHLTGTFYATTVAR